MNRWPDKLNQEEADETLPLPVAQSTEGQLCAAGAWARLREDPGRPIEAGAAPARISGDQSGRPGPGPCRRRCDLARVARDPRLSRRDDGQVVAGDGSRAGRGAAIALLSIAAHRAT